MEDECMKTFGILIKGRFSFHTHMKGMFLQNSAKSYNVSLKVGSSRSHFFIMHSLLYPNRRQI